MNRINKAIDDPHFIDSFWGHLSRSLGLSPKYSSHYITADKSSGTAQIAFDIPQIIHKEWIKKKTLEAVSDFSAGIYHFNIQQNGEEFIIHRDVINPVNLEQSEEEYSINLKISDNECRINIKDLCPKKIIDHEKTNHGYTGDITDGYPI